MRPIVAQASPQLVSTQCWRPDTTDKDVNNNKSQIGESHDDSQPESKQTLQPRTDRSNTWSIWKHFKTPVIRQMSSCSATSSATGATSMTRTRALNDAALVDGSRILGALQDQ